VITGLSARGRRTCRGLEDAGWFCVDNLPTALVPSFADLIRRRRRSGARPSWWTSGSAASGGVSRGLPRGQAGGRPRPEPRLPGGGRADAAAALQRDAPPPPAGRRGCRRSRDPGRAGGPPRRPQDGGRDPRHVSLHRAPAPRLRPRALRREGGGRADGRLRPLLRLQARGSRPRPTSSSTPASCRTRTSSRGCGGLSGADAPVVSYPPATAGDGGGSCGASSPSSGSCCPGTSGEGRAYLTIAVGCTGGRHRSVMLRERRWGRRGGGGASRCASITGTEAGVSA